MNWRVYCYSLLKLLISVLIKLLYRLNGAGYPIHFVMNDRTGVVFGMFTSREEANKCCQHLRKKYEEENSKDTHRYIVKRWWVTSEFIDPHDFVDTLFSYKE